MTGIEVGQEIDNFQVIFGEITKAVPGQAQAPDQVLIDTELDVSRVGNMIILLRSVQTKQQQKKMQQILDSEEQ